MTEHEESSSALLGQYPSDSDKHQDGSYDTHYDAEKCGDQNIQIHRSKFQYWTSAIGKLIIVGLALWGLFDILQSAAVKLKANHNSSCWCGNSDAEAIAMGCRFDHIAVDWLPLHCIDEELTTEFDHAGPGHLGAWDYFKDRNGTERLNDVEIDEYAVAAKDYYTTQEWHMAHCIYVWRKQFRTKFTGKFVEPWNDNEEHIMHCSRYFMSRANSLSIVDTTIPGTNRHPKGGHH